MPDKVKKSGWQLWGDVTAALESLVNEVDAAKRSETFKTWLNYQATFHRYSFYNTLLILMQMPEATRVAGYKDWLKVGRHVKKDEHGLAILAPSSKKVVDEDGEEGRKMYFVKVFVFDRSQTEGDEEPQLTWFGTERNEEVEKKLVEFAEGRGIKVSRDLKGTARGVSKGGVIQLLPDAGTSTLIHEIAHEMLHRNSDKRREVKEAEAEGTAYVVCKALGIPTTGHDNYLAGWADVPTLKSTLKTIASASKEILQVLGV